MALLVRMPVARCYFSFINGAMDWCKSTVGRLLPVLIVMTLARISSPGTCRRGFAMFKGACREICKSAGIPIIIAIMTTLSQLASYY